METLRELPGLMFRVLLEPAAIAWLAFVVVAGWILLPLFRRLLGQLRIGWYFASRVGALGLLAYIPWLLSHDAAAAFGGSERPVLSEILGAAARGPSMMAFSTVLLVSILLALAIGTFLWYWEGREVIADIRKESRAIIAGEALFLGVFLLMAALRLVSHGIVGQEKFMDMAFFRACLEATIMPPADPWLYHSPINYYYGGYLVYSLPARVLGTEPAVAYNLAVALVYTLGATMAYTLVWELTGKIRWGILGVFLALFAGNLAPLAQIARHVRSMPHAEQFAFDWWAPSRVIHDRLPGAEPMALINEFPFFAAYLADLHPHLMVIPFSLFFAIGLFNFLKIPEAATRYRFLYLLLPSWTLGMLLFINPFDALAWGSVGALVIVGASLLRHTASGSGRALLMALLLCFGLVVAAISFFIPFLANYTLPAAPDEGGLPVRLTEFRSNPVSFFMVWGLFVTLLGTWLIAQTARRRRRFTREGRFVWNVSLIAGSAFAMWALGGVVAGLLFAAVIYTIVLMIRHPGTPSVFFSRSLVLAALVLLLGCELFYISDSYGRGLQRMNTVFKFHFIAWILLGVGLPAVLRPQFRQWRDMRSQWPVYAGMVLVISLGAVYPILAIDRRVRDYESHNLGPPSLDGSRFLDRDVPSDYEAIRWLSANAAPGDILLEATGGPYGVYARVSTFSPVRAVLGWENHQRVWRGSLPERLPWDVRRLYETESTEEKQSLLEKYNVRYVFVGELERRDYPASGLNVFAAILDPVFTSEDGVTVIYRVPEVDDR